MKPEIKQLWLKGQETYSRQWRRKQYTELSEGNTLILALLHDILQRSVFNVTTSSEEMDRVGKKGKVRGETHHGLRLINVEAYVSYYFDEHGNLTRAPMSVLITMRQGDKDRVFTVETGAWISYSLHSSKVMIRQLKLKWPQDFQSDEISLVCFDVEFFPENTKKP